MPPLFALPIWTLCLRPQSQLFTPRCRYFSISDPHRIAHLKKYIISCIDSDQHISWDCHGKCYGDSIYHNKCSSAKERTGKFRSTARTGSPWTAYKRPIVSQQCLKCVQLYTNDLIISGYNSYGLIKTSGKFEIDFVAISLTGGSIDY